MKITPAHDFNDFEVGKRHELALINILDARRRSSTTTRAGDLSRRSTASRRASASSPIWRRWACSRRSSRRRTPCRTATAPASSIEPWLTDQWYVNAAELAKPAIAAVESGETDVRAEELGEDLLRVDAQHPALVHLAPALVGPPDPGVVRAGRQDLRRARRERSSRLAAARALRQGRRR